MIDDILTTADGLAALVVSSQEYFSVCAIVVMHVIQGMTGIATLCTT